MHQASRTLGPRTGVPCVSARRRSVFISKLGFKFVTHMSTSLSYLPPPMHTQRRLHVNEQSSGFFHFSTCQKSLSPSRPTVNHTFCLSRCSGGKTKRQNKPPNGHRRKEGFSEARHSLCCKTGMIACVEMGKLILAILL